MVEGGELRLSGFAKYAIVDSAVPSCIINNVRSKFGTVDEEDYLWYFYVKVSNIIESIISELPTLVNRCCMQR